MKFKGTKNWSTADFMERWVVQANYPLIYAEIINNLDNTQTLKVSQSRALNSNSSIFAGDLLYPSPFE